MMNFRTKNCFGLASRAKGVEPIVDPEQDCWNADTDIPVRICEPSRLDAPEFSTIPNDDTMLFLSIEDKEDDKSEGNEEKDEEEIKQGSDNLLEEDKEANQKLSSIWKVWYYHRNNRQEAVHWMANQKVIFELETVGDVMKMVEGIVPLEDLDINQDIAVFRDNIEPWYEDPANEFGGQWTVALKKGEDYSEKLERAWAAMMAFCLMPESPYSDIITGFSFAVRGSVYSKCFVWLKNCEDVDLILDVGAKIATMAKLEDPFLFTNNQTKKVMFSL